MIDTGLREEPVEKNSARSKQSGSVVTGALTPPSGSLAGKLLLVAASPEAESN